MAEDYGRSLDLEVESCFVALSNLQRNALEKLQQRDHFNESGLATIKIKVLNQRSVPQLLTKELTLASLGSDLKEMVSKDIEMPEHKYVIKYC